MNSKAAAMSPTEKLRTATLFEMSPDHSSKNNQNTANEIFDSSLGRTHQSSSTYLNCMLEDQQLPEEIVTSLYM